ncbi:MAG TPA: c-type cytochrome [Thermoanaerobaculia bacterium]
MRRLATVLLAAAAFLVALLSPRSPRTEAPAAGRGTGLWKARLKRWLIESAVILAVFAAGGFLVAASGIIPIKASSGHWAVTRWFLIFSMHRSFSTHSLGIKAPPLDDPALVLRGAGAYETNCRPCHGSPELRHPRVARRMLPEPPYLPPKISEWKPEELFSLVKHGVKLTGMPAWPAQQRDDEVWAMVAFLLKFQDLDAQEYRRLVYGEIPPASEAAPIEGLLGPQNAPRAVAASCGRCHGVDGRGRGAGAFPRLAGQRPAYLYASLQAFARGERHSGIMAPIAAPLSPGEMRELARYYASLPRPSPPRRAATLAAIERGRRIAHRGVPEKRVPSCADCHGPGAIRRKPIYPELAGQYAGYLVQQLQLFQKEHRGGTPFAHLMHPVASRLTPEQMRDVAAYYESLAPGRE